MSGYRRRVEDVDHWILNNSMRFAIALLSPFIGLLTGSEKGKHSHGVVNPYELAVFILFCLRRDGKGINYTYTVLH